MIYRSVCVCVRVISVLVDIIKLIWLTFERTATICHTWPSSSNKTKLFVRGSVKCFIESIVSIPLDVIKIKEWKEERKKRNSCLVDKIK